MLVGRQCSSGIPSPESLPCCTQGFFEANLITTLTYAEDASTGNTTIPMYVVQGVAAAIRYACTCLGDPVNSLLAQLMMGILYGKLTVTSSCGESPSGCP